jgi:hypothetical protein
MSEEFSVFVNSSDSYADCWRPFFQLFRRYWPQCSAPVFLNTERSGWDQGDVPVVCTRVQAGCPGRLTWSQCLGAGLAQVPTPLVLYMQEDYFLHRPVLHSRIMDAARFMLATPSVAHVGLTKHGSRGPHDQCGIPGMLRIRRDAAYRISTQAGLWRTSALASYLDSRENGWMFEIYGTWRARRRDDLFLTMDCDPAYGGPPVDYLHTGIIKGRWLPGIEDVFRAHGIEVDFSERGFYRPKGPLARRLETAGRLFEDPGHLYRQLVGSIRR